MAVIYRLSEEGKRKNKERLIRSLIYSSALLILTLPLGLIPWPSGVRVITNFLILAVATACVYIKQTFSPEYANDEKHREKAKAKCITYAVIYGAVWLLSVILGISDIVAVFVFMYVAVSVFLSVRHTYSMIKALMSQNREFGISAQLNGANVNYALHDVPSNDGDNFILGTLLIGNRAVIYVTSTDDTKYAIDFKDKIEGDGVAFVSEIIYEDAMKKGELDPELINNESTSKLEYAASTASLYIYETIEEICRRNNRKIDYISTSATFVPNYKNLNGRFEHLYNTIDELNAEIEKLESPVDISNYPTDPDFLAQELAKKFNLEIWKPQRDENLVAEIRKQMMERAAQRNKNS